MFLIYSLLFLYGVLIRSPVTSATSDDEVNVLNGCVLNKCECGHVWGALSATCREGNHVRIPTSLGPRFKVLYLTGSPIGSLPARALGSVGLVNLLALSLDNCSITVVDKNAFSDLWELGGVDLSENRIQELDPETFSQNAKLGFVDLSKNPIESLPAGLFKNSPRLRVLKLTGCQLKEIGADDFGPGTDLEYLALNNNQLYYMNVSSVSSARVSRVVKLGGNPWRCDCHLRELHDWYVGRVAVPDDEDPDVPECAEPAHLKGKLWAELNPTEFKC